MEVKIKIFNNEYKEETLVIKPDQETPEQDITFTISGNEEQIYSVNLENIYRALKAFRNISKINNNEY